MCRLPARCHDQGSLEGQRTQEQAHCLHCHQVRGMRLCLPPPINGTRLFGQAKGKLTKTRYKNATIFVIHDSRLQFVYLMTSNSPCWKQSKPSEHLNNLLPCTVSGSNLTTVTIDGLPTTTSNWCASKAISNSPSAGGSMPTFKMK